MQLLAPQSVEGQVLGLPAWLGTAAEMRGELSGVQASTKHVGEIVRHLDAEGVDYYYPRERVVRWYPNGKKVWDRAFIPGCFFLGRGEEGRDVAAEYARFFGWSCRFLTPQGDSQKQLRREVASLGIALYDDPTLTARLGLRVGDYCLVTGGPLMGCRGYVESTGPRNRLWIRLTIFGQSCPCEVPPEFLERA